MNPREFNEDLAAFNELLNQEPDPKILETDRETGYRHIPIAFIEHDLRNIYKGGVQYEILATRQIFNSIQKDVRIKVFHPVFEQWFNYDGCAAVLIESVAPNQKYVDIMTVVKVSDESMADAVVYSEAIKKAAQRIGVRFGSNLNRDPAKTPNGKTKSNYDSEPEKYIFDAAKKYTKKDLLQLVAAGSITVEVMNEYLDNRK